MRSFLALLTNPAEAQQMFPAGGSSGTSCPSGSSHKGQEKAVAPLFQQVQD